MKAQPTTTDFPERAGQQTRDHLLLVGAAGAPGPGRPDTRWTRAIRADCGARQRAAWGGLLCLALLGPAAWGAPPAPRAAGDIPEHFAPRHDAFDYERRETLVPMRDGVRLRTIVLVPHGARAAPMLLTLAPSPPPSPALRERGKFIHRDRQPVYRADS